MIDIHCHLIHGVDDGPSTKRESINMLQEAEKLGIKTIIATPHIKDRNIKLDYILENLYDVVEAAKNIDISIKLGCEFMINPMLPELVKRYKILRMAGSRYVLVELPFDSFPKYCRDVFYKLQLRKFVPIIAHPERNKYLLRNFSDFVNIIDCGCLVQVDAASIIGDKGWMIRSFCKKIIQERLVHFVSSDAHCSIHYTERYQKAYKQVKKWTNEDYARLLFKENGEKLLKNIPI